MTLEPKKSIREEILKRRDSIPLPVRRIKDRAITDRLCALTEFKSAEAVLFYASFRSEVDTAELIKHALGAGKKVFLPRVEGDELYIHEIGGPEDLSPGFMGIPEPSGTRQHEVGEAQIIILPGIAFDERGFRLGYGKGYYDRMLYNVGTRPLLLALAYEEQIVKRVPDEGHDVAVDIIVTDRRIIKRESGL